MAHGTTDLQKKKWVKPEVKQIHAGSAEVAAPNNVPDNPAQQS